MKDFLIITFKADPGLKFAAAAKADELGITLSQVLNQALRDFLEQDNYTFRASKPTTVSLVEEARVKYQRQTHKKNDGEEPKA